MCLQVSYVTILNGTISYKTRMYQPALRTDGPLQPQLPVNSRNSRDTYHNHSADSTHTPSDTFYPAARTGYL